MATVPEGHLELGEAMGELTVVHRDISLDGSSGTGVMDDPYSFDYSPGPDEVVVDRGTRLGRQLFANDNVAAREVTSDLGRYAVVGIGLLNEAFAPPTYRFDEPIGSGEWTDAATRGDGRSNVYSRDVSAYYAAIAGQSIVATRPGIACMVLDTAGLLDRYRPSPAASADPGGWSDAERIRVMLAMVGAGGLTLDKQGVVQDSDGSTSLSGSLDDLNDNHPGRLVLHDDGTSQTLYAHFPGGVDPASLGVESGFILDHGEAGLNTNTSGVSLVRASGASVGRMLVAGVRLAFMATNGPALGSAANQRTAELRTGGPGETWLNLRANATVLAASGDVFAFIPNGNGRVLAHGNRVMCGGSEGGWLVSSPQTPASQDILNHDMIANQVIHPDVVDAADESTTGADYFRASYGAPHGGFVSMVASRNRMRVSRPDVVAARLQCAPKIELAEVRHDRPETYTAVRRDEVIEAASFSTRHPQKTRFERCWFSSKAESGVAGSQYLFSGFNHGVTLDGCVVYMPWDSHFMRPRDQDGATDQSFAGVEYWFAIRKSLILWDNPNAGAICRFDGRFISPRMRLILEDAMFVNLHPGGGLRIRSGSVPTAFELVGWDLGSTHRSWFCDGNGGSGDVVLTDATTTLSEAEYEARHGPQQFGTMPVRADGSVLSGGLGRLPTLQVIRDVWAGVSGLGGGSGYGVGASFERVAAFIGNTMGPFGGTTEVGADRVELVDGVLESEQALIPVQSGVRGRP
ncbi:MAG: hypothetical protein AAGI53_09610 [Planctomycetota bacterium]